MRAARQPADAADLGLLGLGGMVAFAGVLWAAGALSSWLSGHRVPSRRPLAGMLALGHWRDPSAAWGGPVGSSALYWAVTAVVVVAVAAAGWGVVSVWRRSSRDRRVAAGRPESREGMASRREVSRAAGSKALIGRSSLLRGSLPSARPNDVGYRLGASRGVDCWVSVEDSILVLGPPRSGKGLHEVIPMILDAPGAVVTTSTRPDNLAVSLEARSTRGPVMVFDPQRLAGAPAGLGLRWSLTRGCEHAQTAMIRAEALVVDAGRSGVENAGFWRTQALSAVRCLLHAAALDGRSALDLYRWSHTSGAAKEAVAVLTSAAGAIPGWDRALDAIISADPRTRDSTWAMVANAFAPLADPAVLEAVNPPAGSEFDPLAFLAMSGTVYLLGTASGATATAPLVAALIEDLVDAARRLAAQCPGQRLDPPLALILDEAANYPLSSLPSLMSEGGGSGITTVAVVQSLSQARDRWGREAAGAIWDSAIVKVVLGGSSNADDLADLSRLIGERQVTEWSETRHGKGGERSMSSSTRWKPVLEPSELRRMEFGTGLLLLRSASPILMNLQAWTARPDRAALLRARQGWEQAGHQPPQPNGLA